jgi:hypothetical protein
MTSNLHVSAVSPFGVPPPGKILSYPRGTVESGIIRNRAAPPPFFANDKVTFLDEAHRTRANSQNIGGTAMPRTQCITSGVKQFQGHAQSPNTSAAVVSAPHGLAALVSVSKPPSASSISDLLPVKALCIARGADLHQRPARKDLFHPRGSSTQRASGVTSLLSSNSGIFALQAVGSSMPLVIASNVTASFPPPLPSHSAMRGHRVALENCRHVPQSSPSSTLDCVGFSPAHCCNSKGPNCLPLLDTLLRESSPHQQGFASPSEVENSSDAVVSPLASAPSTTPARGSALSAVRAKCEGDSSASKSITRSVLPRTEAVIDISELVSDDVKGEYVVPDWETEAKCRKAMRLKTTAEHREMMAKGCARKGIDYPGFVVCSVGGTVVRNAARAMGFGINEDEESALFDFKWTVCHDDIQYSALSDCQIVNHFEKSAHELGSKIGLLKNIQSLQWFDHVAYQAFVPRTFNLSNPWELEDFIDDYLMTMAASFVIKSSEGIEVESTVLNAALAVVQRRWAKNKNALPPLTLTDYFAMVPEETARWNVKNVARIGVGSVVSSSSSVCQSPSRRSQSPQKGPSAVKRVLNFDAETANATIDEVSIKLTSSNAEDERKNQVQDALSKLSEHWCYHGSDGHHNAWIIKPGHSSRGRGIKCMSNLLDIMKYCLKRKHATIVQKYVETPMLLSAKKFDIRMWICVTDWNPMTLWAFDPCYLRICVQDHTLSDLEDVYKHLCNRCVQVKSGQYIGTEAEAAVAAGAGAGAKDGQKDLKKGKRQDEESESEGDDEEGDVGVHMWDSQQFKEFLDQKYGAESRTWEMKLRPAMWKIAVQTMHAVQDVVKHRRNSFEWFGFDFLIDESLQPWLLEVNISPDMSLATDVLQRVVPLGVADLMGMYFPDQRQPGATTFEVPPQEGHPRWSLIFKGRTVANEVPDFALLSSCATNDPFFRFCKKDTG